MTKPKSAPRKKTAPSPLTRLIENAVDFLSRAIEEFQSKPKYSVVHFYTAVELFLKARLLHEHWSLVISREADKVKFESGDFVSVTFEEACNRLAKVVQSPLPSKAYQNLDAVRRHRNKMVHFFHDGDDDTAVETIAREQLRAWADLNQLLRTQWASVFRPYDPLLATIEKKLSGHRDYLRAKYDTLLPSIKEEKAAGNEYRKCESCEFGAARVSEVHGDLRESKCRVCDYQTKWLEYECSKCGEDGELLEGGEYLCPKCGHTDKTATIVGEVNDFVATKDNYFDATTPANCVECDGHHTVVEFDDKYLCVACFELSEVLDQCGWCAEYSNGDMEGSSWSGCSACPGKAGNLDDDD